MAGHIGGLGYSVRHDINGNPLAGWTLTIYTGGTSTPVSVYQDYSLSLAHTNPVVADANGMMPMFWLTDGTYRVLGRDAQGNTLFDDDGVVALGPSSGTGGGGSSVDSNSLWQTGDFNWQPVAGARTGWVRANARTVGSAASGGTERANSDCENLFLFLWNNFTDSFCPVTGGRGASAAADWAANKLIATLDMRMKSGIGLNDMGNTSAAITGGSTAAATAIGATTYTVAQANLPNVTFTSTALNVPSSAFNGTNVVRGFVQNSEKGSGASIQVLASADTYDLTINARQILGGIPSGGSGTHINIITPARVGSWYIRL